MKELTIDLDARYQMIPVLARKLLDVPFRLYGRDPNDAIDCVAVMAIAATQAGFDCSHILTIGPGGYGRANIALFDAIRIDMTPVKKFNNIRIGDVLWFRIPYAEIDHFAIVSATNPIKMVHTNPLTLQNGTEERLTDVMIPISYYRSLGSWERWLSGAFRFAKLSVEPEIEKAVLGSNNFGPPVARSQASQKPNNSVERLQAPPGELRYNPNT